MGNKGLDIAGPNIFEVTVQRNPAALDASNLQDKTF
jgi:hypothetical protein